MGDLSLTIKSGVQHGLFGGAIANLGTAWHHETFLPGAITSELLGCFAMTELGHGSDVQSIETTITWLPRRPTSSRCTPPRRRPPRPTSATRREHGRMAAVFGQLIVDGEDHGVHCVLVPDPRRGRHDLPGVTIGDHGPQGRAAGRRQRHDHLRPRARAAADAAGPLRRRRRRRHYQSPIESKNAALLHHARHPGPRPDLRRRRGRVGRPQGADDRGPLRRPRAGSSAARGWARRSCCWTTCAHQRRLLPHVARAYAYGFAQNELATAACSSVMDAGRSTRRPRASWRRGRPAEGAC